jgi:hypothetical protein
LVERGGLFAVRGGELSFLLTAFRVCFGEHPSSVVQAGVQAVARVALLRQSVSTCEGNPHAAVTSQLQIPSRTPSQLLRTRLQKPDIVAWQAQARRRAGIARGQGCAR